jgi:hypothetical protein
MDFLMDVIRIVLQRDWADHDFRVAERQLCAGGERILVSGGLRLSAGVECAVAVSGRLPVHSAGDVDGDALLAWYDPDLQYRNEFFISR